MIGSDERMWYVPSESLKSLKLVSGGEVENPDSSKFVVVTDSFTHTQTATYEGNAVEWWVLRICVPMSLELGEFCYDYKKYTGKFQ